MASLKDHAKRYQTFLRRLKQARLDAGLTQIQAATALKKPQSFVSKCETGERRVDIIELQAFADLYQVSLEYFTTDEDK